MLTLKQRVEESMRRNPALTQADIARACKVKTPSVADWLNGKTKSLKPEPARLAAALFGCDQNWIGQGVGVPNWRDPTAQSPKGGPPLGGPRTGGGVAQLLTLGPDTVVPRIVDEESVLSGEAQDRVFRLLVKDASAGPDYPKGAHIIWSRDRRAQPGRLVLVRDKHRQLHIRRMQQGRAPDTWVAAPLNPDYAMLDSIADGLEVVATFDGFQLPPDEV